MAKTLREEDLRLNIVVNGDNGRKKILDLEKAIGESTDAIRTMRKEQTMLAKQGQTDSARYKELTKSIKAETDSIKQNKAELNSLRREMSVNSMTISELGNRAKQLKTQLASAAPGTAEWKRLKSELQETNRRLSELRNQSGRAGSSVSSLVGGITKAAGVIGVAVAAIRRLWRGLSSSVNTMMDFEQANANLATILGKSVQEIKQLSDSAEDLGRATRYTASEVTMLQTELAKLGFSEPQILAMEKPILNFATAVGAELPEAAALAGASLRIFGLNARDTEDMLGAMAVATNKSALDFSFLSESMSIVGPVAKTFGVGVKDTVALLGALANAGFDASSAATATRNIFLNLANANGKLAKEIGKPVRTFPELIQAMQDLNAKGLNLGKTLELTDKRSVSAFNSFLEGAESTKQLRDALEDVDGELQRIADERLNTLSGSTTIFKSAWEGLILTFKNSTGTLKSIVDWMTKLVTKLTDLRDPVGKYRREQNSMYDDMMGMFEDGMNESTFRARISKVFDAALEEEQAAFDEYKKRKNRWTLGRYEDAMQKRINAGTAMDRAMADAFAVTGETPDTGAFAVTGETPDTGGSGGTGEKSKSQWSLQSDEFFLTAKAELTRKYNNQEIATQEEYDKQLYDLEVATLTARIASKKDSAAHIAKLESELQDKVMKHRQDEQKREEQLAKEKSKILADLETDSVKKARAQEDARYAEEQKKYRGNTEMLELIEKQHQNNLAKIESDAQNQEMARLKREHDLSRAALENEWLERIAQTKKGSVEEKQLRKDMARELAALDLEYLNNLKALLEHITDSGEFAGLAIPEEQLDAFKKQLQDVIKQINETSFALKGNSEEGGILSGTGGGSLFGVRQEEWEQLFANLAQGKLGAEGLGTALNAMAGIAQQGFQIASQAVAMTNAKEQEELKAFQKANDTKKKDLQKRLDAGLISRAQYDSEIEKMDTEMEAKEEEMSIRQAEREKRLNIVQAIINTALSATKVLAQFGLPYGLVAAGIVGAMGAAQVAIMESTPVSGRESGGYFGDDGSRMTVRRKQDGRLFPARLSPDRRGWVSGPTVLVGENGSEYVIPSDALQNPSIRPFVDAIETARQNGRLRNLRLEAVQPGAAVIGRASGGYVSDAGTDGSIVMPDGARLSAVSYQEFVQLLRQMSRIFSEPIKAEVAMLGRNGIVEKTEEYNRAKGRGQL